MFFYFRIGSIFWHVEENLGFSIYLNNLLSPRTQDCIDVSHLKISWELMKSGAWYWCDNYAREDINNSQCAKWHDENWSNVKKRRQRHASLTTTSASAVFQNLNDWLLVSENISFQASFDFFFRWEVNIRLDEVLLGCWGLTWLDCGRCPVVGGENSPLGRLRLRAEGEM